MTLDTIPTWAFFAGMVLLVLLSTEAGYRIGRRAHRRSEEELEAPISSISSSILGLGGFILAFTFGIVSNRYDARKVLVIEEANAVRTAYHRADFLPVSDAGEARKLLRDYLDLRLDFVEEGSLDPERLNEVLSRTSLIQDRLWDVAVAHGRTDMNSEIGSLYIQSLNDIFETHARRLAVGLQARIPGEIWLVLIGLTILGMLSMGYHTGIAGSARSLTSLILAISFAMVIAVIAALDRPTGFVRVTQRPLIDLRQSLSDAN